MTAGSDFSDRVVSSADPAAGAEASLTVPDGVEWEVVSVTIKAVFDATAVTRIVGIEVGHDDRRFTDNSASLANETNVYTFDESGVVMDAGTAAIGHGPMPRTTLKPGDVVATNTVNLQAGDNLGPLRLWVRERIIPQGVPT